MMGLRRGAVTDWAFYGQQLPKVIERLASQTLSTPISREQQISLSLSFLSVIHILCISNGFALFKRFAVKKNVCFSQSRIKRVV